MNKIIVSSIITIFYLLTSINIYSQEKDSLKKSILQVKVTSQSPNFMYPWQMKKPQTYEMVGILIEKNKILTLASNLEYHTSIEIRKFSNVKSSEAKPLKIDYESNLAILTIEDESYLDDVVPIQFIDKNEIGSSVSIVQTDNNGSLQSSRGRIINMDMDTYPLGHIELPFLNLNSNEKLEGIGEIILEKNQPSGILYKYSSSKNNGRAIPGFIIQRFINTLDKKNSPFPYKGFRFRPVVDDATRDYYGLREDKEGVLIAEILPFSGADGVLQLNDILLEFEGEKIDSQGYFNHPEYGKQSISFLAHCGFEFGLKKGTKVNLRILRDKKEMVVVLPLKQFPYKSIKIPYTHNFNKPPNYILRAGFLFTELSEFLLKEWGQNWRARVDRKLVYLVDYHKYHENRSKGKIIILLQVLPDEINNGYHNLSLEIVKSVDGREVGSIKEMDGILNDTSTDISEIEMDSGTTIALDKNEIKKADARISKKFNIMKLGRY